MTAPLQNTPGGYGLVLEENGYAGKVAIQIFVKTCLSCFLWHWKRLLCETCDQWQASWLLFITPSPVTWQLRMTLSTLFQRDSRLYTSGLFFSSNPVSRNSTFSLSLQTTLPEETGPWILCMLMLKRPPFLPLLHICICAIFFSVLVYFFLLLYYSGFTLFTIINSSFLTLLCNCNETISQRRSVKFRLSDICVHKTRVNILQCIIYYSNLRAIRKARSHKPH